MIPLPHCLCAYTLVPRQQGKYIWLLQGIKPGPLRWELAITTTMLQADGEFFQTHYFKFELALYKSLLHAIATHSLANNTLPALQKTKLDILPLAPLLFYMGFTKSKLISFPSWETVADGQMRVCFAARFLLFRVIEPGLLQ